MNEQLDGLPVSGDEPPACDDCGEHHEGYGDCPAQLDVSPIQGGV